MFARYNDEIGAGLSISPALKRLLPSNSKGRPPLHNERQRMAELTETAAVRLLLRGYNGTVGYDKLARHLLRALGQIGDFARWRWTAHHEPPSPLNCEKQYFERLNRA